MNKIKITQVKSIIKCSNNQKKTIKALGLRKINQKVEHLYTPQILGMIRKVRHLLKIETNEICKKL
ncbi:50S ribosomal protein L30 [Candidatus Walczuchella endosymbiont of Icerya purchasi]|uniref:50S ribosomal protein L30 n=1 Tax=Candidatus Walczuchella endosymbiont of Icerya purchasi TaxID=3066219 RepID=UPI00313D3144